MSVLIIKLGATGDVVRTTPLLRRLDGPVSWITAENNVALPEGIDREVRCVSWENRKHVADADYDLVINREMSMFLKELICLRFHRRTLMKVTGAFGQRTETAT